MGLEALPSLVTQELSHSDGNGTGLDERRVGTQERGRGMWDGLLELPNAHAWQGTTGTSGRARKGHPLDTGQRAAATITHDHAASHGPRASPTGTP